MASDKGVLFTEGQYLSKEAISAHYNLANVEEVWAQVEKYRDLFRLALPLKSLNNLTFNLVLTKNLLKRLYNLERKLTNLLLRAIRLKPQDLAHLTGLAEAEELRAVAASYNLSLNAREIDKLRLETTVPATSEAIVYNYASAQRLVAKDYLATLDTTFVNNLNQSLQGMATTPAETAAINERLQPLLDFLNQDDEVPLFAKATIALFWFKYVKPYEYFNTETAALLAKAYLANQGYYGIAYLLPFETFTFQIMEKMDQVFALAVKTLDLTYIVDAYLIYFEQKVTDAQNFVMQTEAHALALESALIASPAPSIAVNDTETLKENKGMSNIDTLLEEYPALNKKQAHFYLTHQTVGRFYTIEQFKAWEKVAYETARTSMELLTRLSFYSKAKAGKHFTYTPIPKN